MHILTLPDGKHISWYLDKEQEIAELIEEFGGEPVLFTWRVGPTVIYGRHQIVENEVNLEYCRTHGIEVYQRKSGGGAVYADRGNLMISYISPSTHSETVFQEFLHLVVNMLRDRGFTAVTTAHNDVLVDGCKVSGTACYALPHATIVHGTLLERVDLEQMSCALTPPKEKLQKHGVESVRQRVKNLYGNK